MKLLRPAQTAPGRRDNVSLQMVDEKYSGAKLC
jgi:hypothetical protein